MLQQQLGAMQINRIIEYTSSEYVRTNFFPETTPDDWVQHEAWMKPHAMDAETGNLTLIMQAFLVRTRHHNIIVDTCVGDHKPRPSRANWHMQARGTVPATWPPLGYNRSRSTMCSARTCTLIMWAGIRAGRMDAGSPHFPMPSTSSPGKNGNSGNPCRVMSGQFTLSIA